MNYVRRAAALAAALTLSSFAAAQDTHPRHSLVRGLDASHARPAHSKRARPVVVDTSTLEIPTLKRNGKMRVSRSVEIALFDDVFISARLTDAERHVNGAIVWTGKVENDPRSDVTIAVSSGVVSATITTAAGRFQIVPAGNGQHDAVEIDEASFEDDAEPVRVSNGVAHLAAATTPQPDTGWTIDLLVAYTDVLEGGIGGEAAVQTLISNAVAATNAAFGNSAVIPRVRLVGTMKLIYDDRLVNSQTTLQRLRATADGFMDEVHAFRNATGADAVSLLVFRPTDSSVCGIGYLITKPADATAPTYAFNVVRQNCAVANLSFPHELGHNFGLEHDRRNAGGAEGSHPFAYGYQDPSSLFRDVMAYNCSLGCPRLQYFSNPDVFVSGRPMGVNYLLTNSADNARALNANAMFMSQWRTATTPPVSFTDDPLVPSVTAIRAVHLAELRAAIDLLRTRTGLPPATWSNASLASATIRATHIVELRAALTPALTAIGQSAIYIDPELAFGSTVKAAHIQQLRDLTK